MDKIVIGKTIEEAVENACSELNINKDDLSYEVVEYPNKGFFGLGSKPAKINVSYKISPEKYIKEYFKQLFSLLKIEHYDEKIEITEDNSINIQINSEEAEAFTMKHSDIVEPLQFLLAMTVNRQFEDHYKVTFNINDYKEKSISRLEALAVKTANQVLKTQKKVSLFPMSAYQRRVVHSRIQGFENITTFSVGVEPNRKVVVAYQGANALPKQGKRGKDFSSKTVTDKKPSSNIAAGFRKESEVKAERLKKENEGNVVNNRASEFVRVTETRRPYKDRTAHQDAGRQNRKPTTAATPFKLKQIYPKPVDEGSEQNSSEKDN